MIEQGRQDRRPDHRGVPGRGRQCRLELGPRLRRDPRRPARRRILADDGGDLHPDPQAAEGPGRRRRGAQVLRLGLCQGRQDGRGPRLRADAGQGRRPTSRRSGRARSRTRAASRSTRWPIEAARARRRRRDAAPSSLCTAVAETACAAAQRPLDWALRGTARRACMQPARRRSVVDVALQGEAVGIGAVVEPSQGARPAAPQRCRLPSADARGGDRRPGHPRRRHRLAVHRLACRRSRAFGFNFLIDERWNPVTEKFGALAPIYGTLVTSFIAMLIAVPVGLLIAMFLTELCPDVAAPADRHRDRAARRHSQHHLRHLGPVRVRAVPAADAAAVPDHGVRRHPDPVVGVRRAALRHRRADRRPDPRHHGAALHHLDLARRVRRRAAGAQGSRLRPRLHHLGGRALRRAALYAASA